MKELFERWKGTKLEIPYNPEHPVWGVTQEMVLHWLEQYGAEEYNRRMGMRNERIFLEETNPLEYGYEPAVWKLADVILGFISIDEFLAQHIVPDRWKLSRALMDDIRLAREREVRRILVSGGNRASKTEWMCKRLVQQMKKFARNIAWLFHSNERMSVTVHQKVIYKYLPNEWKAAGPRRETIAYIAYNQQNGFSGNKITGPNGSEIHFLFYEQDPTRTIEGGEVGDPGKQPSIGVATDELVPMNFVETLEYRCATRRAAMVHGFTPIEGYSDVVARYQDGSHDVYLELGTALNDPKPVPLVKRCHHRMRRMVFFHSHYNAYANWAELKEITQEDADPVRLTRLYGIATKMRGARFPRFSEQIHVVPPERIFKTVEQDLRKDFAFEGTNWHGLDPAGSGSKGGKNWFMLWVRVDAMNNLWVYREWPNTVFYTPGIGLMEPWAVGGSNKQGNRYDGIPGGGVKTIGFGLDDYKELIAGFEGWDDAKEGTKSISAWNEFKGSEEMVYARTIDSRFAAHETTTHSGHTTLLNELAIMGLSFEPAYATEGRGTVEEGADLISDKLQYKDPDDEEAAKGLLWKPGRGPKLFISEDCQNLIFAMKTWTNSDGQNSATKDPIDVLRYLINIGACYVPHSERSWRAHKARGGPSISLLEKIKRAR